MTTTVLAVILSATTRSASAVPWLSRALMTYISTGAGTSHATPRNT